MVEPRRDLDLGEEPVRAEHRAQLGPQHLERDLALVLEVLGEVDRRHAARAELALDAVAVAQSGRETCGIGHQGLTRCGPGRPAASTALPLLRASGLLLL